MKYHLHLITFFVLSIVCGAQNNATRTVETNSSRPKLVVGIVVDQMRYDYLTRFADRYGEGGFKRMMNEGFNCKNNHFNYVPTSTGPGHASVYTGTTPKYHGIIGNDWYDNVQKASVYCAGDDSMESVGVEGKSGKMSPHRMLTTTFPDENRLFTQMRGKTIGISIKDRGAVLPAGHTGNAAYWFHGEDKGHFITSSYYMQNLPKWVQDFNNSNTVKSYFKPWDTYYDISTYTESGTDLNNFEGGFKGKDQATFPYDLNALKETNGGYSILRTTPYGNTILTDFALAAVKGEDLGKDGYTDVLAISYSSPDYIGHNFGVNSKEIQDTYIRLDRDLERLFNQLDIMVGKGEYTVFLSSDHAAGDVPAYLKSVKIPAGYIDTRLQSQKIRDFMAKEFGDATLIESISNNQIFLNRTKIKEMKLDLEKVQKALVDELITYPDISNAYTANVMNSTQFHHGIEGLLQRGFSQKRSGDVLFVYNAAFISYGITGSTHGSGLNFDTHAPLLFFGKGIKQGSTFQRTEITDIAPTMSALLGISFPSASTGTPLEFVFK